MPSTIVCAKCGETYECEDSANADMMPDGILVGGDWYCANCSRCESCWGTCIPNVYCGCDVDCFHDDPDDLE